MRSRRLSQDSPDLDLLPVLNLISMLIPMLLASSEFVPLAVVDTKLPVLADAPAASGEEDPLRVAIAISPEGFDIQGVLLVSAGGTEGPTVPRAAGEFDYEGLTEALTRLKDQYPEEDSIVLMPDPALPLDVLVRTMDAARTDLSGRPLFPEVVIAARGGD